MSHRTILLLTSLAALSLPLGCGSSVTIAGDAGPGSDVPSTDVPAMDVPPVDVPSVDVPMPGRVPRRHRASAMTCPSVRPPSSCEGGSFPGGTCTADSDCTTGVNGRCVGNSHDGCRCNYDVCTNDSECMAGGPCECRLASRGAAGANVCLGGNCQVDANCGAGGYCSPTLGDCGEYGGLVGYYCHTPADECIDDEDCVGLDAGFVGQRPYCMYSRQVGRWRCSNQGCVG